MTPTLDHVELLGTTVPIKSAGSGAPLLILEGTNNVEGWLPIYDSLARHHRVVLVGHPGFGGRPLPAWLDSVSDLASFYLDLLERLDLRGVHLIGFSLGGWIAAELATRNTTRLKSLSLIAPPGLRRAGSAGIDLFLLTEQQRIKNLVVQQDLAERLIADYLSPETEEQRLQGEVVTATLAWQPRWFDPSLPKWLHRIDKPTAIIWGTDDRFMPAALGDLWCEAIPGAKLFRIDRCGHLPQLEQREELAAILERFLNTVGD